VLVLYAFILLLASSAQADALPLWLPEGIRSQITDHSPSNLYLCDPYCEPIGEFATDHEFKSTCSADLLKEASLPKNRSKLQVLLDTNQFLTADPADEHTAEKVSKAPQMAKTEKPPQEKAQEQKKEQAEAGDTVAPTEESAGDVPVFLGAHLDALFGATSLNTSSNTDVASDALTHGIVGGGLNVETRDLTNFAGGNVSASLDVSARDSLGQKSKESTSNQSWSSQQFRLLLDGTWAQPKSHWKLGLILEGFEDNENSDPDTAVAFSSEYTWFSIGAEVTYKKTTLKVFKSVFNSTQDVDQYRGTQVTSSRTAFELDSCLGLGKILSGGLDLCGVGLLSFVNVDGSGTPLQPVFTTDPSYKYTSWATGIQLKLWGISL
jgi:hypothetical protein